MEASAEVELLRDPNSASRARNLVSDLSAGALDSGQLDRAKLLVSELVANAVVHGRGVITLRARLDENRLLVEVIDEGSGFEWVARQKDFGQIGGLGLSVVDAEASRWGIHEGTTHVWFEIERTGLRLASEKLSTKCLLTAAPRSAAAGQVGSVVQPGSGGRRDVPSGTPQHGRDRPSGGDVASSAVPFRPGPRGVFVVPARARPAGVGSFAW